MLETRRFGIGGNIPADQPGLYGAGQSSPEGGPDVTGRHS